MDRFTESDSAPPVNADRVGATVARNGDRRDRVNEMRPTSPTRGLVRHRRSSSKFNLSPYTDERREAARAASFPNSRHASTTRMKCSWEAQRRLTQERRLRLACSWKERMRLVDSWEQRRRHQPYALAHTATVQKINRHESQWNELTKEWGPVRFSPPPSLDESRYENVTESSTQARQESRAQPSDGEALSLKRSSEEVCWGCNERIRNGFWRNTTISQTIKMDWFSDACKLCQLLASHSPDGYLFQMSLHTVKASWIFGAQPTNFFDSVFWGARHTDYCPSPYWDGTGRVALGPKQLMRYGRGGNLIGMAREHQEAAPSSPSAFRARGVKVILEDYARLQGWIRVCKSNHARGCPVEKKKIQGIRLIDCHAWTIVKPPANCMYTALSYRWPSSSTPPIANNHRVPTSAPLIIKDAIQATRRLGYQFLWVDQFCIPQEAQDEKMYQIRNMDRIYSGADVTLIACADPQMPGHEGRDMYGLPGVSQRPRIPQPNFEARMQPGAENFRMFSTLPPLPGLIKGTSWSRRGWTYQEALLSPRRLFFTDFQVYFVCNRMDCRESNYRRATSLLAKTYPAVCIL